MPFSFFTLSIVPIYVLGNENQEGLFQCKCFSPFFVKLKKSLLGEQYFFYSDILKKKTIYSTYI
jgi:hypothetical protein